MARTLSAAAMHKLAKRRHKKAKQIHRRRVKAKRHFDEAHAKGMNAIKRHDYDAVTRAIDDEIAAIHELVGPQRTKKGPAR